MRSSFKKLRGFAFGKYASKSKNSPEPATPDPPSPDVDPTRENMQVAEDMKQQYDNLLALAQSISAASFDFSTSIEEMMSCMLGMLEKTEDEEIVGVVTMLAKVQYEISKFLKIYGAHVSDTIVRPTENLLKELQSIEEIKNQWEEERRRHNQITSGKKKGKTNLPGDQLSSAQVKEKMYKRVLQLDMRFKSLKHGQDLSLVTQAIRHYTAQCVFFNKSLDSLNAVDALVKNISERLNIDRTLDYDNLEVGIADDDEEGSPRSPKVGKLEIDSYSTQDVQRMYANSSKSAPLHVTGTRNGTANVDFMLQKLPQKKEEDAMNTKYVLPNPSVANVRTHNQPTVRFGTNEVQIIEADAIDKADPHENEKSHSSYRSPRHVVGASVDFSYMQEMDNASYMPAYSHSGPLPSKYSHSGPLQSNAKMHHKQRIETNLIAGDGAWQSNNHHHTANSNNKTKPWGGYASPPLPPPRISPSSSPIAAPASNSSVPIISELHKLPTPPRREDPIVQFSAPLGRNDDIEIEQKPEGKTMSQNLSFGTVKKSRSIPSSVAFARSLQHSSSFGDSPIIELPQ